MSFTSSTHWKVPSRSLFRAIKSETDARDFRLSGQI